MGGCTYGVEKKMEFTSMFYGSTVHSILVFSPKIIIIIIIIIIMKRSSTELYVRLVTLIPCVSE